MVRWWHSVSISIIKSSLSSTQLWDPERYEWILSFWLFSQTLAAGVVPNPSAPLSLPLSSTTKSQLWQGLNGELRRKKCHKATNKQRTMKCSDSQVIWLKKLQLILMFSWMCFRVSYIAFKFIADPLECVISCDSVSNWANNRNSVRETKRNEKQGTLGVTKIGFLKGVWICIWLVF